MSLHLDFEPHSYYKGFAIKKDELASPETAWKWYAVTLDGMTGYIVELEADTLKELKQLITDTLKELRQLITDYHQRNAERDAYNRALIGE